MQSGRESRVSMSSRSDCSFSSRSHKSHQQAAKTKRKPKHIRKRVKHCIQELIIEDDESNAEAFKDLSVDMISSMVDEITGENTTELHPPVEMKLK